jgi:nucleoside-diphosphate-sugar epimerase
MSGGGDRPILVTGGAGFIGCNIVNRLAAPRMDIGCSSMIPWRVRGSSGTSPG